MSKTIVVTKGCPYVYHMYNEELGYIIVKIVKSGITTSVACCLEEHTNNEFLQSLYKERIENNVLFMVNNERLERI